MNGRAAIRTAARSLIVAAATAAGSRVYTNRTEPMEQAPTELGGGIALPAVLLYTPSEESEIFDESPRRYRRRLTLRAECVRRISADTAAIDDELDTFAGQVERALLTDPTLGNAVDDCELTGTDTTINDEGQALIGAAVLTFRVSYYTEEPEPLAPSLDDLVEIRTEIDLAGANEAPADRAQTIIGDLDQ